jgi:hypothetical protein
VRRRAVRRLACGLALAAVALVAGCGRAPGPAAAPWAAAVADAHHEADARLDAGDPAGARARLQALADAEAPHAPGDDPRRLALQDTYFRLSQLALAAHDARQALADADAGLGYGEAPHLFVANLLVARGAAREAEGDPRGAAADYHRALTMNEALLAAALAHPEAGQ